MSAKKEPKKEPKKETKPFESLLDFKCPVCHRMSVVKGVCQRCESLKPEQPKE